MRLAFMLIGLVWLTAGSAHAQPAAATLDAAHLPATAPGGTLLRVTAAGRFAITAHSPSGAAISLVDMITGPTTEAGAPGAADGRLDLLLDVGTYKVRTHPAAGAQGDVQLRVTPSRDVAPPVTVPPDGAIDASLADFQQRGFWFAVPAHQAVLIEAAGRALADLRLWRDGRDLLAARADETTIEPTHGHPLRDFRFSEVLPAGIYLLTAYGGPALPWADGAPALPFHVRAGVPDSLRLGWVSGRIGPFGSARFRTGGADDLVRLTMDGPATLLADGQEADIDQRSRVPRAELRMPSRVGDHEVDVRGPEGTAFQLRSLHIGGTTRIARPGTFWLTANTTGFGGDDVPATLVLARSNAKGGFDVVGSDAPEIGPGAAWRRRFNLGGPVSVLFHLTTGGKVAVAVAGVPIRPARVLALDSQVFAPPADPQAPLVWDLPAGWFELFLEPAGDAAGVADVTVGPPGPPPAMGAPGPAAPSITFGAQTIAWPEHLELFGNHAPGAAYGLESRPMPVDVSAMPLRISQAAGQTIDIPLRAGTGTLAALEIGSGPVPVGWAADAGRATLPAVDYARSVALISRAPPAAQPETQPAPEEARPALHDTVPRFADFADGDARSFKLSVAKGGLFEVETLGRLRTRGAIGTHFIPELAVADANGTGQNMRLQTWLRAGHYRVDVTAEASSGHAGLLAAPATLQTTSALLPGGTVRAALPAGSGLLVPVIIAASGSYRLELLGLAHTFSARLEDADGWPLTASAPLDTLTQDLAPGAYRLLVMPQAVDAGAVVRLTRIVPPPVLAGHGPHALPFDAPQDFTWREPAGRTDPRRPDEWRFALAAPADVTLSVTDGMEALLSGPGGHQAAHLVGGALFANRLMAGDYHLTASSQGRNDRLDYTLSLSATQLQPGVPRSVDLPASLPFAVAADQVVSLTSFGPVPVRAVLRDAAGAVLGRYGAREAEWNIVISRPLPAGAYTLELASAAPPPGRATPRNANDAAAPAPAPEPDDDADRQADPPADQAQAMPAATDGDAPPDAAQPAAAQTQVTLSLPADAPVVTLSGQGEATLRDGGVHRVALPRPRPGQLILAGASASSAVMLSLEQAEGSAWRSRALAQGQAPLLALPADGSAGAWRLSVWSVDGGTLPIRMAARLVDQPAVAGQPRLLPVAVPGVADGLGVAHVALAGRGVLRLSGAADVLVGNWPGHPAAAAEAGIVAPQADDLWLVASGQPSLSLAPLPSGSAMTMTIPPGASAALPQQAAKLAAWVADAQGQPSFRGAGTAGVADGSALALACGSGVTVFNAGDADALRVSMRPLRLTLLALRPLADALSATFPPATASPLALPPGPHAVQVDLAPGMALVAGWPSPDATVVWAGQAAVSRTIEGDWTRLLLVNTASAPAAATLSVGAPSRDAAIVPHAAFRRFFGAAGSLELPVDAALGESLVVTGGTATVVDAQGLVRRGARISLAGLARAVLTHPAGLLAAWLDGPGADPWPASPMVVVRPPQSLALTGPAMRLAVAQTEPGLLRVRSTAPVILMLDRDAPALFPAGAATSRFLPAGTHTMLVVAAQDGELSGTLDLTTTSVRPATEGVGDTVAVAPGDSELFGFSLPAPARVGLAARAQPDRVTLTLLDAQGRSLAGGAAMLRDLPAGSYVLQANVPPDAPTTLVRPAIVGLTQRSHGPPPDVVATYRALARLTSPKDAAP